VSLNISTPLSDRPQEWRREGIPFLNGGLFERHYGEVSLPLADDLFSTENGLLGFLDGWTFTVAEEASDESEVAVDPEMLGRVFENLISEEEMRREGKVRSTRLCSPARSRPPSVSCVRSTPRSARVRSYSV
jgi:hypothetical protein